MKMNGAEQKTKGAKKSDINGCGEMEESAVTESTGTRYGKMVGHIQCCNEKDTTTSRQK